MSRPLIAILGTRYNDFAIEEEVLGRFGGSIVAGNGGTPADIVATAGQADVVLAGSGPRFDGDVLSRLTCQGIVRYGVGTDSIDLAAAARLGIAVARVADYGTEAVALHAVASALAMLRRLPDADRAVRDGQWGFTGLRPLHLPRTLTAGVVGYGRIGRQTARYLAGFGFTICAHDPYADIPVADEVRSTGLDELLESSDLVSLHVPGDGQRGPLLDAGRLARMRDGSVLINTARGSLIDIPALVAGLRRGRPARAALDVYPREPVDLSLFHSVEDRVLFTPHMAWYTDESETDMRRKAAAEAGRLLDGKPLRDPVVSQEGQAP